MSGSVEPPPLPAPPTSASPERVRARLAARHARPWRLALAAYAAALTAGTHWPELNVGTEENPYPDKLVHMSAFGGLALLLVLARIMPPWAAGLVAAGWAALDEVSQALPGLGRTISREDLIASTAGVAVVMAWVWALGPLGGLATQTRLACRTHLLGEVYTRRRAWLLTAAVASAGAAVAGLVAWGLWRGLAAAAGAEGFETVALGAALGAVAAAHAAAAALCRGAARDIRGLRPCFGCGASCAGELFDEPGRGRCPACSEPIHRGQWSVPMDLPLSVALRGAGAAAAVAAAVILACMACFGSLLILSSHLPPARAVMSWWYDLGPGTRHTIDLALVIVAAAAAARVYRRHQSHLEDRQHLWCRRCRHDLSETPLREGCGRCGECGLPFVRFSHHSGAADRC